MLTADGIFFFLARCVYVLLWRCNTSLTGLVFTRRLFLELLISFHISSLIDSAKDSTHFLLSASTISFPVCTTVLYSFFYLSWCCHTSFIGTFCGELITKLHLDFLSNSVQLCVGKVHFIYSMGTYIFKTGWGSF